MVVIYTLFLYQPTKTYFQHVFLASVGAVGIMEMAGPMGTMQLWGSHYFLRFSYHPIIYIVFYL